MKKTYYDAYNSERKLVKTTLEQAFKEFNTVLIENRYGGDVVRQLVNQEGDVLYLIPDSAFDYWTTDVEKIIDFVTQERIERITGFNT